MQMKIFCRASLVCK